MSNIHYFIEIAHFHVLTAIMSIWTRDLREIGGFQIATEWSHFPLTHGRYFFVASRIRHRSVHQLKFLVCVSIFPESQSVSVKYFVVVRSFVCRLTAFHETGSDKTTVRHVQSMKIVMANYSLVSLQLQGVVAVQAIRRGVIPKISLDHETPVPVDQRFGVFRRVERPTRTLQVLDVAVVGSGEEQIVSAQTWLLQDSGQLPFDFLWSDDHWHDLGLCRLRISAKHSFRANKSNRTSCIFV